MKRVDAWRVGLTLIGMLVALPIIAIAVLSLFPEENIWQHLSSTVLPRYVVTTITLLIGVGIGVCLLGVPSAWLVSTCEFPGRRVFQWLLLLPLAIPAFVIAYVYTDLLEYAGPVQTAMRTLFDWQRPSDYWFPQIRSVGGAIAMLSLVLYPYVYMLCRAAFIELSPNLLDAARVMGMPPWRVFFRVVLPIIRPALAIGVSLSLMEALNDFGTVDYFAVQTLTAGLYDTWLNMNNLGGAAQIACVMLLFVLILIGTERISRRRQRYFQSYRGSRTASRTQLRGFHSGLAFLLCLLPSLFGFVLPALILLRYAFQQFESSYTAAFRAQTLNSLLVSLTATAATLILAIIIAYGQRLRDDRWSRAMLQISGLGYAMPGVVLALGLLVPFSAFDNSVDAFMRATFGVSTGLVLSGSVFAVTCAYVVRFLAISTGAVGASLARVTPSMDMAARSLGYGPVRTLARFHLPLMRGGLITALVVVFVDCMKELPATLILRPLNFDTLAVGVYFLANDEMIEHAALGALVIVLVGILPVLLLTSTMQPSGKPRRSVNDRNDTDHKDSDSDAPSGAKAIAITN